jgi:hypothetical protein
LEDYDVLSEEQDFLILSYEEIDFFVNRDQFSSSTSLDDVKKIKSSISYINQAFKYNGQNILLFDCDRFLQDLYNCSNTTSSRLCLLMKIHNFSDVGKPLVKRLLGANHSISDEWLGLIISSNSEISKISINEIYLSPLGVREKLNNHGLYGCRFPSTEKIQFFIDLEMILNNVIKGNIGENINC